MASGVPVVVPIRTFVVSFLRDERGILGSIGSVLGIAGAAKNLLGGSAKTISAGQNFKSLATEMKEWGLHPLVAANVNPAVASTPGGMVGDNLAQLGQSIARAAGVNKDKVDRDKQEISDALDLKRKQLENKLLESQITSVTRATTPPAPGAVYNIPGQTSSGTVIVPREIVANMGDTEVGKAAAHRKVDFSNGSLVRVPSDDLQQSVEEGPANWYYQFTRTIPDMAKADLKYMYLNSLPTYSRRR